MAYEKPSWQISAVDNSPAALEVAADNARALGLNNVRLLEGDWYKNLPLPIESNDGYRIILANPPYLTKEDAHLSGSSLSWEPIRALVSENNGFADLYRIIRIAKKLLNLEGWLLLEHGYNQRVSVENFLLESGFVDVKCLRDVAGNARVSVARHTKLIERFFVFMNDEQLLRYSRQILLPEVDLSGQQVLLKSNVLIIGLGGLGSPAALYLGGAGVGSLTLVDDDAVDLSNLQRQIAHGQNDLSRNKAESASDSVLALNSGLKVKAVPYRLRNEDLKLQVSLADVVVDATDNFESRFEINEACINLRKPLVSGSAIRMEGQIAVFDNSGGGPCYRCVYASGGDDSNLNCVENGVLAPVVGVIGAMLALETVKLILGIGSSLNSRLLLLDGKLMNWSEVKILKNRTCPACSEA